MSRRLRCLRRFPLALVLFLPLLHGAAPGAWSAAGLAEIEQEVVEKEFPNGLRVLLLPRRTAPTVSLYLRFRVGSVEEGAGRSGLAHLLEHMMFKGTRTLGTRDFGAEKPLRDRVEEVAASLDEEILRGAAGDRAKIEELRQRLKALQEEARRFVVKDEIDAIYTANGARGLNASTGVDLTTFKVNLPSNRLRLWAAIERERMSDPVMREFYSERDVVVEERRQSFETDPTRRLMALLLSVAYRAHPYRRPVIGWEGEVDFLRSREAEEFFRYWYTPDNAVLAVVGDIDPAEVLDVIGRYLGTLPRGEAKRMRIVGEPLQEGERRAVLLMDAQPELMIAFHKPTLPSRDDYVFDLIDGLLSRGRTSRLHHRLVEEDRIALSVFTTSGVPGARFPNLFVIQAIPRYPHSALEVEEAILDELERLGREPVTAEELGRVKSQMRADTLRGLQSNEGMASLLSYFEAVAGEWRYAITHLEVMEGISPDEIREVAARHFTSSNRTVVRLDTSPPAEER